LDFGAGKGRIFKEFSHEEFNKKELKYYALEPNDDNYQDLEKLTLEGVYRSYSQLPDSFFDYIVLCNVLHEIPITDWW
jgi:hypothetical protein